MLRAPTPAQKLSIDSYLESFAADGKITTTPNVFRCEYASGWNVETNQGTEFVDSDNVPESAIDDAASELGLLDGEELSESQLLDVFRDYLDGSEAYSVDFVSEWQAWWTLPGYLDQGSLHSGDSETDAIRELLESDGNTEGDTVEDWAADALYRLAEIANTAEDTRQRESALDALCWNLPQRDSAPFHPYPDDQPKHIQYSGDANPVDHDGAWFDDRDWQDGYANCVRIQSAESMVWIEAGNTNKIGTRDEIAETYGIDSDEITPAHEIDYAYGQSGIEVDSSRVFRRLNDSGWFADSEGELCPESALESRLRQLVDALAK